MRVAGLQQSLLGSKEGMGPRGDTGRLSGSRGGPRSKDGQEQGRTGRAAEEAQGRPRTHSGLWAGGRTLALLLHPHDSWPGWDQTDPTGCRKGR